MSRSKCVINLGRIGYRFFSNTATELEHLEQSGKEVAKVIRKVNINLPHEFVMLLKAVRNAIFSITSSASPSSNTSQHAPKMSTHITDGYYSHPVLPQAPVNWISSLTDSLDSIETECTGFLHSSRHLPKIMDCKQLTQGQSLHGGVAAWAHPITPYDNTFLKNHILKNKIIVVDDVESLQEKMSECKMDDLEPMYFEPNHKIKGRIPVYGKAVHYTTLKTIDGCGRLTDEPVPITPLGFIHAGCFYMTKNWLGKAYRCISMHKAKQVLEHHFGVLSNTFNNPSTELECNFPQLNSALDEVTKTFEKHGEKYKGMLSVHATNEAKVGILSTCGGLNGFDHNEAGKIITEIEMDSLAIEKLTPLINAHRQINLTRNKA